MEDKIGNKLVEKFRKAVSSFLYFDGTKEDERFSYDYELFQGYRFVNYGGSIAERYYIELWVGVNRGGDFFIEYRFIDNKLKCTNFEGEYSRLTLGNAATMARCCFISFLCIESDLVPFYDKKRYKNNLECFNVEVDSTTLLPIDKPWLDIKRFKEEFGVELKNITKYYQESDGKLHEQVQFDAVGSKESIIVFARVMLGVDWKAEYSNAEIDGFFEEYKEN